MDRFYAVHHIRYSPYDEKVRFIFCSRRLVKLIISKSFYGKWNKTYLIANHDYGDNFIITAMSLDGLLLITKKKGFI